MGEEWKELVSPPVILPHLRQGLYQVPNLELISQGLQPTGKSVENQLNSNRHHD